MKDDDAVEDQGLKKLSYGEGRGPRATAPRVRPGQVVQSVFELQDRDVGVQYVKLVKSPTGPHHIIDVMFVTGLRLTVDLYPGDSSKKLGEELLQKSRMYRASSAPHLEEAIGMIAECGERAMSDRVVQNELDVMNSELMKQLWEETALARSIRSPLLCGLEYEDALAVLREFYPGAAP